ncbi:MAG: DUF4251 domain-containing protein [bacterium]|jgi:hypothetical protein
MKIISIFIVTMLLSIPLTAQEMSRKEQRKLEKELKQEQKAKESAAKAAITKILVEGQRFVLEADRLRDRRGNTVNVPATLNFIAVDSLEGVLQVGSNSYVGRNGVGGITEQGTVSNYSYKLNEKNGSYTVTYYLRSPGGSYDVQMVVYSDGRADATVSSTWPGKLNYSGFLVAPGASRVWKGTTRY